MSAATEEPTEKDRPDGVVDEAPDPGAGTPWPWSSSPVSWTCWT
ncbi:hypothetical protein NKH77_04155 [Streptomyces sp. M19]